MKLTFLQSLVIAASLSASPGFAAELLATDFASAVPEEAEGKWTALCESGAGAELVEVELTVERSVEAHPGPTVRTAGCDRSVALIRDVPLKLGPVTTTFRGARELPAGTSMDIQWKGEVVRVVIPATVGGRPPEITLEKGATSQTLAAAHYGGVPKLLWAGDLDGDAELDLLFVSERSEWSDHQLFTSKGRKKGSLVKLAAHFPISGC